MALQDQICKIRRALKTREVNPRLLAGIAAIAIVVIGIAVYSIWSTQVGMRQDEEPAFAIEKSDRALDEPSQDVICVHVSGHVNNPGVVYVSSGSRVADAIEAAGGFSSEAAEASINLARVLEDGEHIHVMSIEESSLPTGEDQADAASSIVEQSAQATSASQTSSNSGSKGNGLININTASSAELQTISGIGQAKAQKIIDYRTANGPFKSVDDLTKVNGIGDKTLASIRSSICV